MLLELDIRNFALIDHVHLELGGGLHVLTGETGAGKSILIDAIGALVGGKMDAGDIRPGADRASIEGIFLLPPAPPDPPPGSLWQLLREHELLDDDAGDTLILRRELVRGGRTVVRVNGRAVPLSVVQQIGQALIDIHGQSGHLTLLRPEKQLDLLDTYGKLLPLRRKVAALVDEYHAVRRELQLLQRDEREIARRIDLLQFQVEEIDAAALKAGEDEALLRERTVLQNAERILRLAEQAYEALAGTDEAPGVIDLAGQACMALAELVRYDPLLQDEAGRLGELAALADDIAAALRRYRDAIELDPQRLEEVEQRLDVIASLKRKYGDSIEEILRYREEAAQELDRLLHAEERSGELAAREQELLEHVGRAAAELSAARRAAAERLAAEALAELQSLGMPGVRFEVQVTRVEDPAGVPVDGRRYAFDRTGIDRVTFLVSPNPGEPLKPVARIASGGETARIMLALKSALAAADETPTLIFDEIDVGVGGRSGRVIGEKLWNLSANRQVLCITHLPQVACFGDVHWYIEKRVERRDGTERTVTTVKRLSEAERLDELSQMLGATGEAARQSGAELLEEAVRWKDGRKQARSA